jgi:hypothetical protein
VDHVVKAYPPDGSGSGVDISCLVDTVTVNHGRDDSGSQPEASSASVDFTATPNDPLPAVVEIGGVITVTTTTPTVTSVRFSGRITDLALGWDDAGEDTPDNGVGKLTAVGILAELGRRVIGDVPWPQELDGARVSRVMSAAGITLDPAYSDPGTVQIIARDVDSQPALGVAQDAAASGGGIVWSTKAGEIRYADSMHRKGIQPALSLDSCDILITPTWRRTLEGLVNEVSIGYGAAPDGGEQPRYTATEPTSQGKFGRYGYSVTTALAALADAQAMGQLLLVRNSTPVWVMAALPVDVPSLTAAEYDALLGLEMHSLVTLTGLPAISSAPTTANLWVEGWKETLEYGRHDIELVVSGYCRTVPPPRWDDVDPAWIWGSQTLTERRRNTIRNPAARVNLTDWSFGPGTGGVVSSARMTDGSLTIPETGQAIPYYQRATWTTPPTAWASTGPVIGAPSTDAINVTGGAVTTLSAYCRTSHADRNMQIVCTFHDAAAAQVGTVTGPLVAVGGTTWRRVTATVTVPAAAVRGYMRIYSNSSGTNWTAGDTVDLAAILVESAGSAGVYIDGATPDVVNTWDYAWAGPADASQSVQSSIATVSGGVPSDLTWDGATCWGPPANYGRWNDQPATLRWDQVPAATTWDTYTGS